MEKTSLENLMKGKGEGDGLIDCICNRVEERFHEMAEREPLLRIAISRDFNFKSLKNDEHSQENPVPPVEGAKTNNPSGESMSLFITLL